MDYLASAEDLAVRLGVELEPVQANRAMAHASAVIRRVGRQDYSFVAQETVELAGGERILTLPQRPIVVNDANPLAITELGDFGDIDVIMVAGRDFRRIGNELMRGYPLWNTTRLMGWPWNRSLGVWTPRVRVTYSHGYDVIPDDIASLVVDVAQLMYSNPTGLRQFTTPEYSETYASEVLGKGTVAGIRAQLAGTGRRRGAFSI